MATVQIEQSVLDRAREREAILQRIITNPDAKKLLQQAQKTAIPESVIPELDAQHAVEPVLNEIKGGLAALQKRLDDDAAARETEKVTARFNDDWNRQKSMLRQQGFMDDFINQIEKHAQDEGIPNLRAAANDFLALNPPPAPAQQNGAFGGWDFLDGNGGEDKYVENLWSTASPGEPGGKESLLNAEIAAALADVRSTQPMALRR